VLVRDPLRVRLVHASRTGRGIAMTATATPPLSPIGEAALRLAARGWAVFPCNGKRPLTRHGVKDASKDPEQIRAWWTKHPDANIGVATGAASGIVGLDIDLKPGGEESFAKLEAENGALPPTLTVRTGSGGRHLYYKHPGGHVPNSAGQLGPGLDVRGDGGYLIAAGSVHECGGAYEVIDDREPVNLPPWLLARIVAPKDESGTTSAPAAAASRERTDFGPAGGTAYGLRALDEEALAVETTPEGSRNDALNRASYRIGRLVGGSELDQMFAARRLVEAGMRAGLSREESIRTVKSGIVHGSRRPRSAPPRKRRRSKPAGASPGATSTATPAADAMAADAPVAAPGARVPRITIHTKECVVADQSIAALARLDGVYHRGHALVHVVRDAGRLSGVVRPAGAPHIVALGCAGIRERLTRAADFVRVTDMGLIPAHPPAWLPTAIEARRQWPEIACLEAVTESPVLRPDGTILDAEGYDRETGLLLLPDTKYPAVPPTPSAEEIRGARDLLLDVVCDFPFQSPAHLAAWIAALLTLLARFAFFGPSPLFVIDANVRGAGKTMLADLIGIISSGRPMPRTPQAADEAEEIKRITAIALAGDRFVLIDNINRPLGSGALDTVLTGTTWSDRILGKSEKVTLPLVTVWYASGNNITLKGDTARRCLHIRLDSNLEKPEHRENFKYPNLLRHAAEERAALVAAGLTVLRGYCAAGRPAAGLKPWGSFEGWSGLVRGAVVWAGLADPGETRAELEQVDTDANVLADLVMGWEELPDELGTCGCTIAQALDALRDAPGPRRFARLRSALAEVCPHPPDQLPTAKKVGYALRRFRGRVVQGRKLQTRLCEGNNRWFVERVGGTSPPTPPTPPVDTFLPGLKELDDVLLTV
jgi:hypothetical protein